jgi:tetratricopeptide (TPR) repeat protein
MGERMLRWEQTEFLLKGLYLGLLVMVAWQIPSAEEVRQVGLWTAGGLAVCLAVAAWHKFREGYRVRGRLLGFLLFLVLENPGMVYAGLLLGLSFGTYMTFKDRDPVRGPLMEWDSLIPAAGGVVLGVIFYAMRYVRDRSVRFRMGLALVVVLTGGLVGAYYYRPDLFDPRQLYMTGVLLLLGLPGFYLLTFASMIEESEVEIAAMCAALAIGSWILVDQTPGMPYWVKGLPLVVPPAVYYLYTRKVLPTLRVSKHALRGLSYRQVGNNRLALISLSRALQLDPANTLAREQLWEIHRELDVTQLAREPELVLLLNFQLCLERVAQLLLRERPTPAQIEEAHRLLDLIASQAPAMRPSCAYWRAVALTHQKRYDGAAAELGSILKLPQQDTPSRRAVHFPAWQLALVLHPELAKWVGKPLLEKAGQRLDAIAAVERQLAQVPNDPAAWDLKRVLYSELDERDYDSATRGGVAPSFDHEYTKQLGLALLTDPQRWPRGCEYLRIAARGLPAQAAGLYIQIAQTHEKQGDAAGMWENYQRAMHVGRTVGAGNLDPAGRKELFAIVRKVGELAVKEGRVDAALEAYKFYSQYDDGEKLETYRTLADLFEKKKDPWMALNCTEHALSYRGDDADLVARKDRYYYSIFPNELRERYESVKLWFDGAYCLEKARWVLEQRGGDLDLLDWASHLTELALTAMPESVTAKFLRARIHRYRGEISEAVAALEDIRLNRPQKFASGDDETSWYLAHRMLGDLYLDTKPDQAILCFQEFSRHSSMSGADTLYKMGKAYENLGDFTRAARHYEQVTGYEQHPLYYEARDALERVRRRMRGERDWPVDTLTEKPQGELPDSGNQIARQPGLEDSAQGVGPEGV